MRGYTQQDLARHAGLSQSAIGSYETGQRLSSRSIRRLALVLNVNLDWLEMGRGQMEFISELHEPGLHDPGQHDSASPMRPVPDDWPFRNISPKQVHALSNRDLGVLENMMRSFIEACQAEHRPSKPRKR